MLGVPPTRPETGYGYIERGHEVDPANVPSGGIPAWSVKRFIEKPDRNRAEGFFASSAYAWNSGIFLWSAKTLANAIRQYCADVVAPLEKIAAAYGTPEFAQVFAAEYGKSVPTLAWTLRCWSHARKRAKRRRKFIACRRILGGTIWGRGRRCMSTRRTAPRSCCGRRNVMDSADPGSITMDAGGDYVYAPGKVVSLIRVHNLVRGGNGRCAAGDDEGPGAGGWEDCGGAAQGRARGCDLELRGAAKEGAVVERFGQCAGAGSAAGPSAA